MSDETAAASQAPEPPLEAALKYAALGWPVIPLHTARGGGCSCSRSSTCDRAGKHPRTEHGVTDATTDEAIIRAWWSRWPDANVGIATGTISGVVVLDIDNGGDVELAKLEAKYVALPPTVEVITGSGKRHYYFSAPEGVALGNSAGTIEKGIDVRASGGHIVAPPSLHKTGNRYEWVPDRGPEQIALAAMPDWLLRLATARRTQAREVASGPGEIVEGTRNTVLYSTGCSLLRKNLGPASIEAALLEENLIKCDPPLTEEEVRRIAVNVEKRRNPSPADAPPSGSVDALLQPPNAVVRVLDATAQKQQVLNMYSSICRLMRAEAQAILGGQLAWDDMLLAPTVSRAGRSPMELSPSDRSRIHERMEVLYPPGKDLNGRPLYSRGLIDLALEQVAQEHAYHPVRAYLSSLRWDGIKRLEQLRAEILNSEDPKIADIVLRRWMISAVARAMTPGCKVDTVLILVGPQGAGKSSFFQALASEPWFSDSTIDIHNKDAYMALARAWIVEFPELESMQRARDVDSVKAFLSSRVDAYRPPYGRSVMKVPRSCVVVGTTNQDTFLTDPTGNRRYWPLNVGVDIDLGRVRADRDQLWAEALVAFDAGEQWWLSQIEEQQLAELRSQFDVIDPWDDQIDQYLRQNARDGRRSLQGKPSPFSSGEVLDGLGKPKGHWTRADEMRVATILKRKGYQSTRETDSSGKRRRLWKHPLWEPAVQIERAVPPVPSQPLDRSWGGHFDSRDAPAMPKVAQPLSGEPSVQPDRADQPK